MPDIWNEGSSVEVTVNVTGSAAIAYTLDPNTAFQLLDVAISNATSPATTENLVVTISAADSDAADVVIYTKNMDAVDDLYRNWDRMRRSIGDQVTFAWTNSNTVTYKMTIKYKRIF